MYTYQSRTLKRGWNTFSIFLVFALLFPLYLTSPLGVSTAYADEGGDEVPEVFISEVAWMGTLEGGSDEWIEFYNTTDDDTSLLGWTLTASDGTPLITIDESCNTTNIPSEGYFLLERTDDDSVPGVSADCIYSGSLENDGEILTLKDSGSTTINIIDAESGWPAGDNDTKETMQYCFNEWVTATATPKAGCSNEQEQEQEQEEESEPICGNSIFEEGEMCDDGNTIDGDGCNNICELETFQCTDTEEADGWYGEYFNYLESHPDMGLPSELWPDANHGDPLSVNSSWDTDWYDEEYFKFSRVDDNLIFGEDFFPFDIAPEETHTGGQLETSDHEFHFGVHWRALVSGEPGVYDYTLTSDDDAWVYVNGILIEDNAGAHPPLTKVASTTLSGSDIVDIFFVERHTHRSFLSFEFDGELSYTPLPKRCQPSIEVCKYQDLTGDSKSDDDIPLSQWGVGLVNTENPVIEIETEILSLNLVGESSVITGENGCYLFENLTPGTYRAVEASKDNWIPTDFNPQEVYEDVLDGLIEIASTTTRTADSFFDVFVEVSVDYGEQETVEFYNYNLEYCGDEIVNQEWEQCDGTDGCTQQCQLEEGQMCSDLVLAQVNIDEILNEGAGNATSTIHVGSAANAIPNGTWFPLFWNGEFFADSDITSYEDVDGLAVERTEGKVRVVTHGSKERDDREHTRGTVEFYNAEVLEVVSDSQNGLGKKNKLEKGFDGDKTLSPGQDEVSTTTSPTTIEYWLTTNVADDGFITSWEIVEDCIGICGVKFGDTNQNGEQDEEESNLSGWEIELFDIEHSTSTPIMTTATTEGGYCFTDIEEGTYVVSEVMQSGWASTTPDSVEVYFSGEERLTVDFGNFQATSSIHGLKYHDEDGDGERDEGEAGLAGWVIVLSSQEEVVATTTTMEGGEYWFTDLAPGEYTVSEEAQLGWGQTQPSEGASYEVTLGLGETLEDLIFGNEEVPLPECSDGIDNDEDEYTDEDDPACHTDGNPENPESFNPTGDETDLNITNEDNGEAGDDSITVVWDTNKPATSRVVYGTTSVPTLGDAPNYGYPFSTIEDPTLVESHSVLISELETDVTYYWRAISSASPEVVGEELTFSISSDDGGDDNGEGGSPFVSPPTGDGGGGTSPYIYGQGGGGGGTIPASLFTPTTPTETGGTPNPVIAQITTPIPTTSTGGGEVGDGTVIGAGETDIEPISDITEGQLAGVGFLGFVYECGPGTTLLTLIILLIIAIYVYKRHDKIWEALIGIIVGAIILWFIGAYNCNWLLVVLALLIIMLIGWDLRQNKEK